jgi:hypothetical protein
MTERTREELWREFFVARLRSPDVNFIESCADEADQALEQYLERFPRADTTKEQT